MTKNWYVSKCFSNDHTHRDAHMHTKKACMRSHTHTHTHRHTHTGIHTHRHTHTGIHTQAYTHRHTHTGIHTHRHVSHLFCLLSEQTEGLVEVQGQLQVFIPRAHINKGCSHRAGRVPSTPLSSSSYHPSRTPPPLIKHSHRAVGNPPFPLLKDIPSILPPLMPLLLVFS
jgi:hypothetical protein